MYDDFWELCRKVAMFVYPADKMLLAL